MKFDGEKKEEREKAKKKKIDSAFKLVWSIAL